jgi:hypothetical protein
MQNLPSFHNQVTVFSVKTKMHASSRTQMYLYQSYRFTAPFTISKIKLHSPLLPFVHRFFRTVDGIPLRHPKKPRRHREPQEKILPDDASRQKRNNVFSCVLLRILIKEA